MTPFSSSFVAVPSHVDLFSPLSCGTSPAQRQGHVLWRFQAAYKTPEATGSPPISLSTESPERSPF